MSQQHSDSVHIDNLFYEDNTSTHKTTNYQDHNEHSSIPSVRLYLLRLFVLIYRDGIFIGHINYINLRSFY